jgi:hypothetical protein
MSMKTNLVRAVAVALLILCPSLIVHAQPRAQSDGPYFPPRGEWQRRTPEQAGLNPTALAAAVEYAQANENRAPRDQAISQAQSFGDSEPHDAIIGPMSERGPMSGLVIYKGNLVAEWGDTARVEMSHSVTKTFLTTVTGLALREGLIRDVNDKARGYISRLRITSRLRGITSSGRPATGRAPCGASPIGPTAPKASPPNGRIGSSTRRASGTSTTTSASMSWPSPHSTYGGGRCPRSCAKS